MSLNDSLKKAHDRIADLEAKGAKVRAWLVSKPLFVQYGIFFVLGGIFFKILGLFF